MVGGNYHCLVSFWSGSTKRHYLSKLSQGQSEQYINIYYDEVSKQPWSKTSIAGFRWQMQLCSRALQHAILMYALLPLSSFLSLSLSRSRYFSPLRANNRTKCNPTVFPAVNCCQMDSVTGWLLPVSRRRSSVLRHVPFEMIEHFGLVVHLLALVVYGSFTWLHSLSAL